MRALVLFICVAILACNISGILAQVILANADNTTSPAPTTPTPTTKDPKPTSEAPNETTSAPHPTTTIPKPTNAPSHCSSFSNCSKCAADHSCVWCSSSSTCIDGSWYGPKPISHTFTVCKKWYWRKCSADMQIIRYVVLAGAGVILILVFCMCFVCCCCRSRPTAPQDAPKTAAERIELEQQERLLGNDSLNKDNSAASRHPRTDEWRQKMRARYGIGGNSADV